MTRWWIAALSTMMVGTAVHAAPLANPKEVKAEDGQTLVLAAVCNACQSDRGKSGTSKKACYTGAEEGWLNGQRCGKCLMESNYGTMLRHPYDLHFTGTLVDDSGQPVKNRFVKMFLPNGWSVRSKTSEQGMFHLGLGATAERKSKQPLVTDLENLVDTRPGQGKDVEYAIFLLPPSYKPCPEAAPTPRKPGGAKP